MPGLGQSNLTPFPQIEDVSAPDDRTVVFQWSRPYPLAGALGDGFQALPRHLLQASFSQGDLAAFSNQPFWSSQYVGMGPYRLDHWDPGSVIEAAAFEGHVSGRAKIDRIAIHFVPDENTALANLLAGDVQFATDRTIRFEQAQILRERWGASGGTAVLTPAQPRHMPIQQRPAFANPRVLVDVRARQALAHAIDRQALNDGLFGGQGTMSETVVTTYFAAYQEVDRAITKYPFDPGQVERLLGSLGYTRGPDGAFASAGERLMLDFRQEAGDQTAREMSIVTDVWRRLGIDSQTTVMSSTQLRDQQFRLTFPSVYATVAGGSHTGGLEYLQNFTAGHTSNYGGWASDEYESPLSCLYQYARGRGAEPPGGADGQADER